jgi:hypothetical protein
MKQRVVLIAVLVANLSAFAGGNPSVMQSVSADSQLSSRMALSGGMGVEYLSAPNVVDFVNASIGAYTRQRVPEFKSAVQFFGALSYPLAADWVLKAEYVYLLGSYNPDIPSIPTEFTLTVNIPSVIIQYVLWDEGLYNLKMGAGLGYHFASLTTKYLTVDDQLSGSGVGGLVEVEANTPFGEHLFAYLGADLRWEMIGTMTSSQNSQVVRLVLPNMHAFGIGARLGLSYYF